jgi:hypothetical protein
MTALQRHGALPVLDGLLGFLELRCGRQGGGQAGDGGNGEKNALHAVNSVRYGFWNAMPRAHRPATAQCTEGWRFRFHRSGNSAALGGRWAAADQSRYG